MSDTLTGQDVCALTGLGGSHGFTQINSENNLLSKKIVGSHEKNVCICFSLRHKVITERFFFVFFFDILCLFFS